MVPTHAYSSIAPRSPFNFPLQRYTSIFMTTPTSMPKFLIVMRCYVFGYTCLLNLLYVLRAKLITSVNNDKLITTIILINMFPPHVSNHKGCHINQNCLLIPKRQQQSRSVFNRIKLYIAAFIFIF